jgi:hypothetical protein
VLAHGFSLGLAHGPSPGFAPVPGSWAGSWPGFWAGSWADSLAGNRAGLPNNITRTFYDRNFLRMSKITNTDKHSSLFLRISSDEQKSFKTLTPREARKLQSD